MPEAPGRPPLGCPRGAGQGSQSAPPASPCTPPPTSLPSPVPAGPWSRLPLTAPPAPNGHCMAPRLPDLQSKDLNLRSFSKAANPSWTLAIQFPAVIPPRASAVCLSFLGLAMTAHPKPKGLKVTEIDRRTALEAGSLKSTCRQGCTSLQWLLASRPQRSLARSCFAPCTSVPQPPLPRRTPGSSLIQSDLSLTNHTFKGIFYSSSHKVYL